LTVRNKVWRERSRYGYISTWLKL